MVLFRCKSKEDIKEAAQLAQKDGMDMNFDVLFKFLDDFKPLS